MAWRRATLRSNQVSRAIAEELVLTPLRESVYGLAPSILSGLVRHAFQASFIT
jgi:hypothetical protein